MIDYLKSLRQQAQGLARKSGWKRFKISVEFKLEEDFSLYTILCYRLDTQHCIGYGCGFSGQQAMQMLRQHMAIKPEQKDDGAQLTFE
ncbi:MAG: hypothetical protein ACPGJS_00750 [Flammeovirgaceae bacterium]